MEIWCMIQCNVIFGQLGFVFFNVYELFFIEVVKVWKGLFQMFFNQIFNFLSKEIQEIFDLIFVVLKNWVIYKLLIEYMQVFVEMYKKELQVQFVLIYEFEGMCLFIRNDDVLYWYKVEELRILIRYWNYYCIVVYKGDELVSLFFKIEEFSEEEFVQEIVKMEKDFCQMGFEFFQQELDVVVYIRGYYVFVVYWFIDIVCMYVMFGLFFCVVLVIEIYFQDKFGFIGNCIIFEMLDQFMEEEGCIGQIC